VKRLDWTQLDDDGRQAALARPALRAERALQDAVRAIVEQVRDGGWEALCEIAQRLDGEEPRLIAVAPMAAEARRSLSAEQVAAMELAAENIRRFHEASMPSDVAIETVPGLSVPKPWRPIDRVGLYVPGGRTPLFSTLLMLAIPAAVAGVRKIVVVTPPRPGGGLDPLVALAADLSNVQAVWTVGGAQAVAALAFGASPISRVDKICGPGNAWVAEAKRLVASMPEGPAIDMPAGPSELMVLADESSQGAIVAADLLGQAEHDAAAQVILVSPSEAVLDAVEQAIESQVGELPRSAFATASLGSARMILVESMKQAVDVANAYAPEHLSLAVADADALLPLVRNAGAVFAGSLAAETFGDYIAGSSHVLPTDGAAKAWSGVSTTTFLKAMSVQTVRPDAARMIAEPAALLARMEGLEAHARAADARLEKVA